CNSQHDGTEDDGTDEHFHQRDEPIAQWFQLYRARRVVIAKEPAGNDCKQNPEVKMTGDAFHKSNCGGRSTWCVSDPLARFARVSPSGGGDYIYPPPGEGEGRRRRQGVAHTPSRGDSRLNCHQFINHGFQPWLHSAAADAAENQPSSRAFLPTPASGPGTVYR